MELSSTAPALPTPPPPPPQTLVDAALEILNTADPVEKARLGEATAVQWLTGAITLPYRADDSIPTIPDRPARLNTVKLVAPQLMPKLGKGGSLRSRQAILHSLAHTESWAIDLSWDIIARFGRQESMPREFFTDFVKVAQDEGRHFMLLAARLREIGSFYGALPAHDGLWDSAIKTSKNLLARIAIEHCVHEARGLDVLPTIIYRFRQGKDEATARLLETVVYPEEITHCSAGVKWFSYLCVRAPGHCQRLIPDCVTPTKEEELSKSEKAGHSDSIPVVCLNQTLNDLEIEGSEKDGTVIQTFHATVREYFSGVLKPPFNAEARKAAGFGPEWYEPLAVKEIDTPN